MRLISRHILRTMAAPFLWGVAALTGLLLLNALPPLIDAFGGKGIAARTMIEGVVLFVPALAALTLPMAVLVAALYGYSQLAANLEMVAMYANGLSVWRMARPALVGAAVVAIVNFFVFDQLMPKSNERFNTLRNAVAQKLPTLALRQQVLNVLPGSNGPSGFIIRADAIAQETGKMHRITIFDLSDYLTRRVIIADSGVMAVSANGRDLILTLHAGEIFEFKRDAPGRLQQTNFVHNQVTVRNVQNDLDPASSRFVVRSEKSMTSCELLDAVDEQRWTTAQGERQREYLTRRDLRALAGLAPELQPAEQMRPPAKPHCGSYRRFEQWFKRLMLPQKLSAQQPTGQQPVTQPPPAQPPMPPLQNPVVAPPIAPQQFLVPPGMPQASQLISDLGLVESSSLQTSGARTQMLIYQVEFHQKFAVPLSSFCFVLIGIALALKFPASGIGLVISGSLVIFLGFYIMLQGGEGIARAGRINIVGAMYAPIVLFTLIGVVSVNGANREMGSARSGGVFDMVRSLFRRGGS
jgi:lipopolysaccharide export LptBFGC system permease protein LptF